MSFGDQSELKPAEPVHGSGIPRRVHDEQCVQYTHEMPHDLKESVGRVVIRVVPVLYGGMFGALINDVPLALTLGAVVSAGMDLAMGDHSVLRTVGRSVLRGGCPVLALIARGLGGLIGALGLQVPTLLRDMRCGVSN